MPALDMFALCFDKKCGMSIEYTGANGSRSSQPPEMLRSVMVSYLSGPRERTFWPIGKR